VERVAKSHAIFWGDYQALSDPLNFYKSRPMGEMGLSTENEATVRVVRVSRMLDDEMYRRIRLNFFHLHCQFISGNDKRALYDYFMLVCGPISAKFQTLAEDGTMSMIAENGARVSIPPSYARRSRREKIVSSARGPQETALLLVSLTGLGVLPLLYVATAIPHFAAYSFHQIAAWLGLFSAIAALGMFQLTHQALLLPNWVAGFAGFVGFGTLYSGRVAREERMTLETFGDSYRAYMARTGRVFPWIL
jgi:protein-S-isoprenylcysteine O-methyltransferase Ste14